MTHPINAAAVLAAIAPVLGFTPTNSLVIIQALGNEFHMMARYDLTGSTDELPGIIDHFRLDPDIEHRFLLVAVCGEAFDHIAGEHLDALASAIIDRGYPIAARLHTRQLDTAGTWTNIDTGESGPTRSYRDSVLAAHMAYETGRPVASSRADIEREFDQREPAPAIHHRCDRELVTATMLRIYAVLAGQATVTTSLAAQAGVLITESVHLRDALLGISAEHLPVAAGMWTQIASHLRAAARIEALALAAACNYANNDGVRAGIAIDVAHTEAEDTGTETGNLIGLLEVSLDAAIPPVEIRKILAGINTQPPAIGA